MSRFTEYTVPAALRAGGRRPASPTTTPLGVQATTEGSNARPSASGITRGMPPSRWAPRRLVVPRSMPTMRDIALFALSQRLGQVVDHGAQVRPSRETLLEPLEQRLAVAAPFDQPVPLPRAADDGVGFGRMARLESRALLAEALSRRGAHALGLGFL